MKRMGEDDLRQRKYIKVETDDDEGRSVRIDEKQDDGSLHDQQIKDDLLPDSVGYGLLIIFLLLVKFFCIFENSLPEQLKIKDADSHAGRFIGERAELQLKRLTNLGTRVVGSYENEVLAVDFLKREISFIAQEANKIHRIEVDVQRPTGSYYLSLKPHAFRNYYANIQNIVVKLSSGNYASSILMNCHYDTVPESPGASDNGLNCAVMLEILRVLSLESTPLKNNVIFLFNGAEENPLQASHGFLSQHKWREEVKVVINLDSAGAGGREVLFQTSGEPWLVKVYAKAVPHPSAGVQAEELFQYGVIPSDTDFRIFRDFGGYPGFDLAHCSNGHIYHTRFDTTDFIRPGVYQNTGDNMLALVRALLNSSLETTRSKTRIVYFDVFYLLMIVYTEEFGICINLLTAALSLYSVYKSLARFSDVNRSFVKTLGIFTGGQLLGLLMAALFVFVVSKVLDRCKTTMSWYQRPSLIIPLYGVAIAFTVAFTLLVFLTYVDNVSLGNKILYSINGAQILWTVILFLGTAKGIRSSFILMLTLLFPSLGVLALTHFKKRFKARTYVMVYLFCSAPPIFYTIHMAVKVFTVMIPMTARMGPHVNPETVIGALAYLTSTIYLSQIMPVFLMLKNTKRLLYVLFTVHVIAILAVALTKYGFPYSGDVKNPALQRFYVLHCDRSFHDAKGAVRRADSGIFIQSLDRNNINFVSGLVPRLQKALSASHDCDKELFCGFPVFTSRFIRPAAHSHWIPAAPPTIHHPTSLEIINQTQVLVNVRRMRVVITGPDHITLGLSPRSGVKLLKWSFDEATPIDIDSSNGRKTYMVYYSHGLMGGSLEFDMDLEIGQDHSDQMMDVAVVGHYMHDKKFRTEEFKALISEFPDWAHVTAWTTTYKSWII